MRHCIIGFALAICSALPVCAAIGRSTTLAHLPDARIDAVKVDASGDIYVIGAVFGTSDTGDAFITKLSSDGSRTIYSTVLGGSKADEAVALDIDSASAAYVFGRTQSADFPVTPGVLQATLGSDIQGFVAKIDPQGNVVYSTLVGDSANVYPHSAGILVDAEGNTILSGQTVGDGFPSSDAAPFTNTDRNTFFVLKLDADGANQLAAVRGVGGALATDDEGSIYVGGTERSSTPIPSTSGAFQSTHPFRTCGGTGQLGFGCAYQYVTKLDASLTHLLYATYVTGSFGAAPAAIFVDAAHNVMLAGSTNSPDYPTTPDAFEPRYIANAPAPPQTCLFGCFVPPPASGYFTKLNATGTALLYSTYFSGTQTDRIDFAGATGDGVILSGQASSPDLPAFVGFPAQCLPATFTTRLSADGSSISAARIVPGYALAYEPLTRTLLAVNGSDLIRFDPEAPPPPVACVVDAADLRPVTSIAPGELLAIFGTHFADVAIPATGPFPLELGGVTVAFNEIPGPLLYTSPEQINIQVPYEIAGSSQVDLNLASADTNESDSLTFPVTERNPTVFLDTVTSRTSPDFFPCTLTAPLSSVGLIPLAFNSDGSRNSCARPAAQGSIMTLYLSGLGITDPAPVTGAIQPDPGVALNLPVSFGDNSAASLAVVSATALAGSISGVWKVEIRVPARSGMFGLSLAVDSVPVRDTNLTLWIQ